MSLPREIELKLLVPPEQLARLRRLAVWKEHGGARARTRRLQSVYFDTEAGDLLQAGVALRVRRAGSRFLQTVKTGETSEAGLFQRIELEAEVPGAAPDLAAIGDAELRARLTRMVDGRTLQPVLETDMQRSARELEFDTARLRADLDIGEIRTAAGTAPICELELELLSGDPAALYACALEIGEEVALRLGTRSKFERGLELLGRRHPEPRRAAPPALAPDADLDTAVQSILAEALAQIAGNEAAARAGTDPEGVHQMRVGVRRLRAALGLLRDALAREPAAALGRELRWLARVLGGVRDLDVFVGEHLTPTLRELAEPQIAAELLGAAQALREERYRELRTALDSACYTRLMLKLGHWLRAGDWRPAPAAAPVPAAVTAAELLERLDRKLHKLDRAPSRLSIRAQHRLRLKLKKLRYACEFFATLFPGHRSRRYVHRLRRLQEVLGQLQDAHQVAGAGMRLLEHAGMQHSGAHREAVGFLAGWARRGAGLAQHELDKRWRALARAEAFWRS